MPTKRIRDSARDRYQTLQLTSAWDLERVRSARALVVGAGALGNEVSKNLAMMGVRRITIVDRDRVEVANLTRSIFFRESDHGRPKTAALAERVREFNLDVEVVEIDGAVEQVLGLGQLRRADLIFSCLDNRLARRAINRMCQKLALPWVDGAMEDFVGEVTLFLPDEGPCYECYLSKTDLEIIAQAVSCRGLALRNISLGKVPTLSTMGSIIGALQVQEALRQLHGNLKQDSGGRKLVLNCEANDFYSTRTARKENCPGHFRYGEVTELPEARHDNTSAHDLLRHFKEETGDDGHLRLGREVVVGLRCWTCDEDERLFAPLSMVSLEKAQCGTCDEIREPLTERVVGGHEPYASWPLGRLGVPALDILEVRGAEACRWFELTGDAADASSKGDVSRE